MENTDRALTIKEVADFLGISNQMVYNLIKARELHAFKIGSALRILYSDLSAYIGQQKKKFAAGADDFVNSDNTQFVVHRLNLAAGAFSLKDIDFALPRGTILGLLGASGSGKTLLLRAVAGLEELNSGCIYLGKKRLDTLESRLRGVGLIFQDHQLLPGGNTQQASGLEQQLALFAREKLDPFELVLMDEPLKRLDRETQQQAAELFSCLGINRLQVEVYEHRILPWQLPTTNADGHYSMLFRTEEIDLAAKGITVHKEEERFYDGRKKLVTCSAAGGSVFNLLVPENTPADFCFLPANLWLFEDNVK